MLEPKDLEFHTTTDEQTIELGRRLAGMLPRQAVVLLIGNLGAGKTTLAKGLISGLGAASPDDVSSPTFTLIHQYGSQAARNAVYHIDLYRLDDAAAVATLGLDEIFDREALVLIEWGERFPQLIPPNHIRINLDPDAADPNIRHIHVTGLPQVTGPPQ